jgi:hypothetical protein
MRALTQAVSPSCLTNALPTIIEMEPRDVLQSAGLVKAIKDSKLMLTTEEYTGIWFLKNIAAFPPHPCRFSASPLLGKEKGQKGK